VATLPLGGHGRPDGGDIRVLSPAGKVVPHRILDAGRGHAVTLAFPVPWETAPRDAKPTFRVYFGNRNARALRETYTGAHGPLLEVRRLAKGGRYGSWKSMQKTIASSTEVIGCMPVRRIFMGLNPLGPEQACVALFRGWLNCRKPGLHFFAVNSFDAAFFLVGGRMVVEWPGKHNPWSGSSGEHCGKVRLERGWHPFLFAHASDRRGVCCSLGALGPGWKRLGLAPLSSFVRWVPVAIGRVESRKRTAPPVAFFVWRHDHDLGLSGRDVVGIQFHERSSVDPAKVTGWHWDFGDGTTSRERDPFHVFLERGLFKVRLTIDLGKGRNAVGVTQAIAVHPIGTPGAQIYNHCRNDATRLASYDPSRLTPEANLNAVFVFRAVEQFDKATPFLEAAFRDRPPLTTPAMVEEAFFLADVLRIDRDDPEKALQIYDYVRAKAARSFDRRWATAWQGFLQLDLLRDRRAACATLEALMREDPRAKDDPVRLALIKLADARLEQGRRDLAEASLVRAQNMRTRRAFRGDFEIAHGQHLVAYEEYMHHRDWAAALRTLEAWEWATPLDKMAGTIQFLRADLHAARGRPRRALVEIHRLEAANPKSSDLPSALILAAVCHEKLGQSAEARKVLSRIVNEFPTSAAAGEARKRLRQRSREAN